ncbi:BDP1 factor, partial [Rhinopomastus cyanomelas]|nr:BDP1 factor [Rhinopomastus cyanomelas]
KRVPRKRGYPEECENREEDNASDRSAKKCFALEKTDVPMQHSSDIEEVASFSEATRQNISTDSEEPSCRRTRQDNRLQSPEILSENNSQVEQEDSQSPERSPESKSQVEQDDSQRQSRRLSKWRAQTSEVRTSSASEYEADCSDEESQSEEVKPRVSRGKHLKTKHRMKYEKAHRSSKVTLVTLWPSQEEEEEADDFEPEYEDVCFAPEEVNKAPVFIPLSLRHPKPSRVQIEETVEELEILMNVPDVPVVPDVESLSYASVQPVVQTEQYVSILAAETTIPENPKVDKGLNDGSTEAAMTLLAMGDPMFQLKTSTEGMKYKPCLFRERRDGAMGATLSFMLLRSRTSGTFYAFSPAELRVEGENHLSQPAGHTSDAAQDPVCPLGRKCTLPAHVEPLIHKQPQVLLPRATLQPVTAQPVLVPRIALTQMQDLTLASATPDTPEMQYVTLDQTGPAGHRSSVLQDFATGSMEPIKQSDRTKKTEKEVINSCGNLGDLRPATVSLEPEKSHPELEACPNQSFVGGIPGQNCCPPQHDICTIHFTQNEARAQDTQQQRVSSTAVSVVKDDRRCPEEEQTFILTLVEIPSDSKEFDAPALLAQASKPLLPAPIHISPIKASETNVAEGESSGSLMASAGESPTPLNSSLGNSQMDCASVESVQNLQTTRKRSAAELEENDFYPTKKTVSAIVVESNLETTHKGLSVKSTSEPMTASGNAFPSTEASAKEVLLSETTSPLAERSQLEILENSESMQEGEVMSRLTSDRKPELSGQEKQEDICESWQLEHSGSLMSSSSTPLLRGERKPLGFLSLICKKSNSESAEDTKGKRGKTQKPQIVTSKRSLKKPTPSTKDDRESCSLPSTSTSSSSVVYENVAADAAVMVPSNKPSEKPCAKDQEKEEEPTRISEYFFSDIFMEVDDSE